MDNNAVKIKEVCFASGFSDSNYFSCIFKKPEGITPREYLSGNKKATD
jgi:YesN/AraC family two-component response regulator